MPFLPPNQQRQSTEGTSTMSYQQSVFMRYHSDTTFLRSFTYKTAAKINWRRYETKLRHFNPVIKSALLRLSPCESMLYPLQLT